MSEKKNRKLLLAALLMNDTDDDLEAVAWSHSLPVTHHSTSTRNQALYETEWSHVTAYPLAISPQLEIPSSFLSFKSFSHSGGGNELPTNTWAVLLLKSVTDGRNCETFLFNNHLQLWLATFSPTTPTSAILNMLFSVAIVTGANVCICANEISKQELCEHGCSEHLNCSCSFIFSSAESKLVGLGTENISMKNTCKKTATKYIRDCDSDPGEGVTVSKVGKNQSFICSLWWHEPGSLPRMPLLKFPAANQTDCWFLLLYITWNCCSSSDWQICHIDALMRQIKKS